MLKRIAYGALYNWCITCFCSIQYVNVCHSRIIMKPSQILCLNSIRKYSYLGVFIPDNKQTGTV